MAKESLEFLKGEYPLLVNSAEECFAITEAILHKLLLQHHTRKDYGLANMLSACLKNAGIETERPSPNLEVHEGNIKEIEDNTEEDAKVVLENKAREDGIELDRRETLANMQEDYDNQLDELEGIGDSDFKDEED